MMHVLLDLPEVRQSLLPLTYTRPIGAIRVGIETIIEKWQRSLPGEWSFGTEPYLQQRFPQQLGDDNLLLHGGLCPNSALLEALTHLERGQSMGYEGQTVALRADRATAQRILEAGAFPDQATTTFEGDATLIEQVWHIFQNNGKEIRTDFDRITANRKSPSLNDPYTQVYAPENIFIEEGVRVKAAILNAEKGPIYLGKGSEIQEGAIVKGPFALGEGAVINMGAKMKGDTTIGPWCKVGGEISNAVFFAYSNKGHDGFVGNSVIGEWCNLGADTNTSNLKNNYASVKLWNYKMGSLANSGQQFCGLIMGDHSKTGINTMFNTGTVVGVNANIFGSGFPPNFVPSYAWGGNQGFTTFRLEKAFEVAERVMPRRNKALDDTEKGILEHIFNISAPYRVWEKG